MFTLTLRIPHRGGDSLRDTTRLAAKHESLVRAWLDEQGVYPVAAIRWDKRYSHTKATCTVLAYPERSAA